MRTINEGKFTLLPRQILKSIAAFLKGVMTPEQKTEIREMIGAAADTGTDVIGDGAPVNYEAAIPNFLETNFPGSNNDLRFEQVGAVTPTIEFQTNGNFASAVVVTGNAIDIRVQFHIGICQLTGATAKALIEASSAAMALVSVSYKSGNNGSGQLTTDTSIDHLPTALSGGQAEIPATTAPPYVRTAGGFLYIQEAGTWKKATLEAL